MAVTIHRKNSKKYVYRKCTVLCGTKGLCFDCLTTGHMTRKSRNKLGCLTCCRSHHSVLQDPNNKKKNNCIMCRSCYRWTNSEQQCPNIGAFYDIGAEPVRWKLKDKNHCVITYAFFDTGNFTLKRGRTTNGGIGQLLIKFMKYDIFAHLTLSISLYPHPSIKKVLIYKDVSENALNGCGNKIGPIVGVHVNKAKIT